MTTIADSMTANDNTDTVTDIIKVKDEVPSEMKSSTY